MSLAVNSRLKKSLVRGLPYTASPSGPPAEKGTCLAPGTCGGGADRGVLGLQSCGVLLDCGKLLLCPAHAEAPRRLQPPPPRPPAPTWLCATGSGLGVTFLRLRGLEKMSSYWASYDMLAHWGTMMSPTAVPSAGAAVSTSTPCAGASTAAALHTGAQEARGRQGAAQ